MTWVQVGPLVGVVVGAILGGGAQILNDWIGARRGYRQQRLEAAQQYAETVTRTMATIDVTGLQKAAQEAGYGVDGYVAASAEMSRSIRDLQAKGFLYCLVDDSPFAQEVTWDIFNMVGQIAINEEDQRPDQGELTKKVRALLNHARRR